MFKSKIIEYIKNRKQLFKGKIITMRYKTGRVSTLGYEFSNELYHCEKCNKYMRKYQMSLKLRTDKKYKEIQPKTIIYNSDRPCIYCYSSEHQRIALENIGRNRMEWLDYLAEAPKLSYVEYEKHIGVLDELDKMIAEEQSIALFLERSGYMDIQIHDPRKFQKEPYKIETLE